MLDIAVYLAAFIVAISVLVAVHEYGHYWVARRLGFKVLRFSIGFGRPLLTWHGRDEDAVEYRVSAIPLGGYVKMLDEREGPVASHEQERAFNRRPIPHRIAVLLAGPAFNFLFAILAYWALFVSGVPGLKPYVEDVTESSLAAEAGLRADDIIESVGGEKTSTWEDAIVAILGELLSDGIIDLEVSNANGDQRRVDLDVRGLESELTEPEALFDGLGIIVGPRAPAMVEGIVPDSPAERAGLANGDRVTAFAGEPVRYWDAWAQEIRKRPGAELTLEVEREGRRIELPVVIGAIEEDGVTVGRIGVAYPGPAAGVLERLQANQRSGVIEGLGQATNKTWEFTTLTMKMLGKMLVGEVSLKNASGPIMIAAYAGESAKAGFNVFLNFLAVISISLGIMNLLPIPILDGGQVVQQLVEWVKGSPLSERSLIVGQQLGIALLLALMSVVFYNDITRLFS